MSTELDRWERAEQAVCDRILIRTERAEKVNMLLRVIASTGRHFFHRGAGQNPEFDYFRIDSRGLPWFESRYGPVYTRRRWLRKNFHHGGTLNALVKRLSDWIMDETPLPNGILGPWPDWYCDGDLWGYGDDMERVRAKAREIGALAGCPKEAA